jgi:hypothetical protein
MSGEHGRPREKPLQRAPLREPDLRRLPELKARSTQDRRSRKGGEREGYGGEPALRRVVPVRQPETRFLYKEGGFARAIELCNGAGSAAEPRGHDVPSFMVTRKRSTRPAAARTRCARSSTAPPPEEMTSERLYQVMDLCISCKGCKAECLERGHGAPQV